MKPYGERVIVRPEVVPETSKGGIVLPSVMNQEPNSGLVTESAIEDIKPGQRVWFPEYAGYDLKVENEEKPLRLLRRQDIMAIDEGD